MILSEGSSIPCQKASLCLLLLLDVCIAAVLLIFSSPRYSLTATTHVPKWLFTR